MKWSALAETQEDVKVLPWCPAHTKDGSTTRHNALTLQGATEQYLLFGRLNLQRGRH